MNKLTIHKGLSTFDLYKKALEFTRTAIQQAIQKHGEARIGLAGGKTPKMLYQELGEAALPWEKITWLLLDERCVPTEDPESNEGMVESTLLRNEPTTAFLHFDPIAESQDSYTRALVDLSTEREPLFDLLILGAGKDGHIASLFEGDEALAVPDYITRAHAQGYASEERITLTLIPLKNAQQALLLLQGEEKAPVLEALTNDHVKDSSTKLPLTALRCLMEEMPLTVLADFA